MSSPASNDRETFFNSTNMAISCISFQTKYPISVISYSYANVPLAFYHSSISTIVSLTGIFASISEFFQPSSKTLMARLTVTQNGAKSLTLAPVLESSLLVQEDGSIASPSLPLVRN